MTNSLDHPQRQSPIAIVANVFNVQALQAFVPVLVLAFGRRPGLVVFAIPLCAVLLVAFSALAWSRTTFWVANGEMILEKGILNKSRTQIPLDRIQQIGTEQGLIQQIFDVRRVRVDPAGTAGSEFALAAVTDQVVSELRASVVGADKVGEAPPPMTPDTAHTTAPSLGAPFGTAPSPPLGTPEPQEDRRTMVLRHEFADLVQLAISRPSSQAIVGLLALGGLGIGGAIESFLTRNITGVIGIVILVVGALVATVVILVGGTMLREFQLTVWRSQEGLRLTAGLLTKRERLARTERVQFVRQRRNLIERRMGRSSMVLPQASSAQVGTADNLSQFSIPGAPENKADDIVGLFLDGERAQPTRPIDRQIVNRKTLLEGVIPALVLGGIAVAIWALEDAENWFALALAVAALFVLVQSRVAAVLFHRHWGWNFDGDQVVIEHGFLAVERVDAAIRKVQSVRIRQALWQRRRQLASVQLGTAGGSFTIPHIPLDVARELRDQILLGVETDSGAWM